MRENRIGVDLAKGKARRETGMERLFVFVCELWLKEELVLLEGITLFYLFLFHF